MSKYDIGIDVGGTGIAAGLVDENCRIVARKNVKTDRSMDAEKLSEIVALLSSELLEEAGEKLTPETNIGLGFPGTANLFKGTIEYANNLPFCSGNIVELLKEKTGCNISIENDANAAAWGEYMNLKDKPGSYVMVTIGTGIGGGIILGDSLIRGVNFAAAELGHMSIKYDGIPCECGRRGCFEKYASAEALMLLGKKKLGEHIAGAKDVFELVRAEDKAAKDVFDEYTDYLAEGIVNIINILQPEVLSIGGGVSKSADVLLPILRRKVSEKIYSKDSEKNTLITAAVLDNDAGIIGAAKLYKCRL